MSTGMTLQRARAPPSPLWSFDGDRQTISAAADCSPEAVSTIRTSGLEGGDDLLPASATRPGERLLSVSVLLDGTVAGWLGPSRDSSQSLPVAILSLDELLLSLSLPELLLLLLLPVPDVDVPEVPLPEVDEDEDELEDRAALGLHGSRR